MWYTHYFNKKISKNKKTKEIFRGILWLLKTKENKTLLELWEEKKHLLNEDYDKFYEWEIGAYFHETSWDNDLLPVISDMWFMKTARKLYDIALVVALSHYKSRYYGDMWWDWGEDNISYMAIALRNKDKSEFEAFLLKYMIEEDIDKYQPRTEITNSIWDYLFKKI